MNKPANVLTTTVLKGGSRKTTAAVEACAALSKSNKRILLIDSDHQSASATKYVGFDPDRTHPNIYHVYLKQVPVNHAFKKTPFGFDLLPSSGILAAVEEALEPKDDLLLKEFLEPILYDYDYIIIDTPPGKGRLVINAILAANWLLIPIEAKQPSLDGVNDTVRFVQEVLLPKYPEELADQQIRIFIATYSQQGGNFHAPGVVKALRNIYQSNVLDMMVPDTMEFARSYGERRPLTYRLSHHPAAKVYYELAHWIIANVN